MYVSLSERLGMGMHAYLGAQVCVRARRLRCQFVTTRGLAASWLMYQKRRWHEFNHALPLLFHPSHSSTMYSPTHRPTPTHSHEGNPHMHTHMCILTKMHAHVRMRVCAAHGSH